MKKFSLKHAPKTFSELVFPSPEMAERFGHYVDGNSFGHILMHGPHGCAKTTIAKMLPNAIVPGIDPNDIQFISAAKDASVDKIRDLANSFMIGTAFTPNSNRLFMILDEADTMSTEAKTVLRGALEKNTENLMVILTSNDVSKFDHGLFDRCDPFDFSNGSVMTYLPLAERVLRAENVALPHDVVVDLVKQHSSSIRQLLRALETVVNGIHKKQQQIAA
jgi:replication factor C subunit 3/5